MIIYAYSVLNYPQTEGLIKIGKTVRDAETRIKEQVGTLAPILDYKIEFAVPVPDFISDGIVHEYLKDHGVECVGQEWFRCTPVQALEGIISILTGVEDPTIGDMIVKYRKDQAMDRWKDKYFYKAVEVYKLLEAEANITLDDYLDIVRTVEEVGLEKIKEINRTIKQYDNVETFKKTLEYVESFKEVNASQLREINRMIGQCNNIKTLIKHIKSFREVSAGQLKEINNFIERGTDIETFKKTLEYVESLPNETKEFLEEFIPYKGKIETFLETFPTWYEKMKELNVETKNLYPILKRFNSSDIGNLYQLHELIHLFEDKGPENILYRDLGLDSPPGMRLIYNLRFLAYLINNEDRVKSMLNDLQWICNSTSITDNLIELNNMLIKWNSLKNQKDDLLIKSFIETNFGESAGGVGSDKYMPFGKHRGKYLSIVKKTDRPYYDWLREETIHTLKCILFVNSTDEEEEFIEETLIERSKIKDMVKDEGVLETVENALATIENGGGPISVVDLTDDINISDIGTIF